MGNETKNYKFPKPSEDDFYDISEYNKAMDILDETLTGMNDRKLDRNGNASNVVTEFSQEILRDNIVSGEKLSVSHGKIRKWFSDMKNIAFSGLASDATQDAAHRFVTDTEKSNWNAKVSASGGDISGTKIGSIETITSEFPVPSEGETSKMYLGKVKKFIQDFNNFKTGIITVGKLVNNGQATAAGYALDARYGKTLLDMYTQLNSDLKDQITTTNSNLNDVKNVSYSVGSGIDANSCSGGIIYLLKKNSLCQIRGSITIIAALNNDSSRSIFSPEFNGQAYSPIPDGMLLTYHVRYQDITGYLSYDATTKTFKLFNYSGKIISANSFIEIWGNYISNF
ncbi:hypothetical protein [Lacrimispora sp.]|uniref:hypothetical protein n=1 Tax=Lacrimispora sp. TaxID=2719234 RepID=UPI00289D219F|nr:hypothetical protein [Lacrimispora sp.]